MAVKRVQAMVSGHVQGVGFRYFVVQVAHRLSLVGTVRNSYDGGVEVIAEGEEQTITDFLAELRHGPSTAEVTNMQVAWTEPAGLERGFTAVS